MTGAPINDYDLDELPTGTAVRVLVRLVGAQQAQVNADSLEIAEIKALLRKAISTGKIVAGLAALIVAATSAAVWAICNLK